MPTRLRFIGLFLLFSVALFAQRAMSVDELVTFIKSQIKMKGDDKTTGDYLKKVKLTQKLDQRTIEELQGQGAGPRTVAAMKVLATESASLPAPPPPAASLPPKPPPSAKEQAEILEQMRDYAMNYTMGLPNYVCVQTTHKKQDPIEALHRLNYIATGSVIKELLTYFDHKETYTVVMVDGKTVANGDHMKLGGVVSSGEFGTLMSNIFDPATGTDFAWQGWHTLRNHSMYGFAYHVDKEYGYHMLDGDTGRTYTSAYKGIVYWDPQEHAIMRITMETVGIPSDFSVKDVNITLDYDRIKVGEEAFILPLHYQLDSKLDKAIASNEADYRLYQKYGAEVSSIKFGDDDPIPADQLKDEPQK